MKNLYSLKIPFIMFLLCIVIAIIYNNFYSEKLIEKCINNPVCIYTVVHSTPTIKDCILSEQCTRKIKEITK